MRQQNIFSTDNYKKAVEGAKVLEVVSKDGRNGVIVDTNLFHPHGGGQKGDRGTIILDGNEYRVKDTVKDKATGEALMVTEQPLPQSAVGQTVTCKLDWDFRYGQMRLHTALHLHHCMLEKVYGKAVKYPKTADIQEGFGFNRYEDGKQVTPELVDAANAAMKDLISQGAEITTYPDETKAGFRWWKCLDWKIPCGGTHLANVSELGDLNIAYSVKNGMPTINIKL